MQEAGPTKFLVGSEHGIILSCTKRPKKQAHGHVKLQQSWDLGPLSYYQMFKTCSVWDWVLLLDGASRVIVVCVLGL